MTTPHSKSALPRFFVEGLVIVVSILLAFAIDAWWENRQEQELMQEHIGVLIVELSQTHNDLQTVLENTESSFRATLQLLRWAASPDLQTLDLASFTDVYNDSMNVGAFLAEDVALTALMTSGKVMNLSNPELLALLGKWQNVIESLELDSGHLESNREKTLLDRMIDSNIDASGFFQPFNEAYFEVLQRDIGQERRYLADKGIKTALAMRANRSSRLLRDYQRARQQLEMIISLLEQEAG